MNINRNQELIGIRVMQKRKEKKYTQEQLSEMMGLSSGQLSCIERGEYTLTTANLFKLCEILGETPNYYLIGEIADNSDEKISSLMKMVPESFQQAIIKCVELYVEAYIKESHNLTK